MHTDNQSNRHYNDNLNKSALQEDTPYQSSLDVKRALISRSPILKKTLEESMSDRVLKPYKPDLT